MPENQKTSLQKSRQHQSCGIIKKLSTKLNDNLLLYINLNPSISLLYVLFLP